MAPSRSRVSTARPSGSQFNASQRPALRPEAAGILARQMQKQPPRYKAPAHPLSATSRRKLAELVSKYNRRNQAAKNLAALKLLGDCAHDLGAFLAATESEVKKAKHREDPNLGELEESLEAYKSKHENLKNRLEKKARACVDLNKRHEGLVAAVERSAAAEPLGQTQRPGAGRRTDGSSFEPTLPGATEDEDGDTTMDSPVESTLEKFKTSKAQRVQQWTSKSLYNRYAEDRAYGEFKALQHEGYYGDEEEAPAPERWFETEEPAPGTATQGAADESDDDIQVARSKISTKCPLTLVEFKHPVMSTVCKHSFEKSAIEEMIGNKPRVQCPVGGCPNYLTRAQLEPNEKLLRKIRRIQQSRRNRREELEDDNAPRGTNADTSILLSDEIEDAGFQSIEQVTQRMKKEKFSQNQGRRSGGGGQQEEDVTDEDDEEGDTEDE